MVISVNSERVVSVLGITGSVGKSTKDVLINGSSEFKVQAVSAGSNVKELAKSAIELKAHYAVISEESLYGELKQALSGTSIEAKSGMSGLIEVASMKADLLVSAISGAVALAPTMAAIKKGTNIALANKECLVCSGSLLKQAALESGAAIIPVDSEHGAIFQLFNSNHQDNIAKIIITASGGPFRTYTKEALHNVTIEQALTHPNWSMGAKITIDSATMMNKALEVIEAYNLFPVNPDQIEVLIHPQSVVHGVIEYKDGSVLAHLGNPDMRTPIAYALAWPDRMAINYTSLKLTQLNHLSFEQVDNDKFPALNLAYKTLKEGGAKPLIFNVANEVAVEQFLNKRISFLNIVEIVESMLNRMDNISINSIEEIIDSISQVRLQTQEYILNGMS